MERPADIPLRFLLKQVRTTQADSADLGLTMPQMALAWVLRRHEVAWHHRRIAAEQIADNVRAIGVPYPLKHMERIDDAIGEVAVQA